jgi:hypothetical protein
MIGAAIALVFFGAVCFAGLALSVASRPSPAPARAVRPAVTARPRPTDPIRVEAIQIPRQRRPGDVHDAAAMERYREHPPRPRRTPRPLRSPAPELRRRAR